MSDFERPAADWRGTTILAVRKGGKVVIVGDGQVSVGNTVMKHGARKVRTLAGGSVLTGFAGATADAFTLFERLEAKLERFPNQLLRACVELAKDWRTDRYLRRLEAMLICADKEGTYVLTGTGDVLEPDHAVAAIGSGGVMRWPRPGRFMIKTLMLKPSHAKPWRLLPIFVCIPMAI